MSTDLADDARWMPTPLAPRRRRDWPAREHLPHPLSSFVGRHREIADVTVLLGRPDVRLVVLISASGVSKTRFAARGGQ